MLPLNCRLIAVVALTMPVASADWSAPVEVKRGRDVVVTYRAGLHGEYLVVEARHARNWHTYAMDNVIRAREKSGEESPQTELPTRIRVEGALKVAGSWRQSPPKDLSDPEILWYTWGFENTAYFAAPVTREEGDSARVTIDGQACDEASCAMVDGVALEVSVGAGAVALEVEPDTLEVVASEPGEDGGE